MNCKNCGQQLEREGVGCAYCGFDAKKDKLDGTVKEKNTEVYKKPSAIRIIKYKSSNGSATTSLVLAILSFLPLLNVITLPASLLCALSGFRSIKYTHSGVATLIVSLVFNAIWIVLYAFFVMFIIALANSF
jgi:hypothetical protein